MATGSSFHSLGAAIENERSPYIMLHFRHDTYGTNDSLIYEGAWLLRALKVIDKIFKSIRLLIGNQCSFCNALDALWSLWIIVTSRAAVFITTCSFFERLYR